MFLREAPGVLRPPVVSERAIRSAQRPHKGVAREIWPPVAFFCSEAIKGMLGDAGHLSIPILEVSGVRER